MKIDEFLSLIKYKPVWISKPCDHDDGVQIVEFRRIKNFTASIEFGRKFNEEKNGYYFYYEIVDWNDYKEGEFIPLDSNRRHDVIFHWVKCDDEYKKLTEKINESLKNHYKRLKN
jgi:hypothetical protein